jgi:hypothetical protein
MHHEIDCMQTVYKLLPISYYTRRRRVGLSAKQALDSVSANVSFAVMAAVPLFCR